MPNLVAFAYQADGTRPSPRKFTYGDLGSFVYASAGVVEELEHHVVALPLFGGVGIAFVTTVLARRTQYHQSVLVAHATPLDTVPDAALHAQAQLARIIQQQSALLGFLDCFWVLGCACLIGAPLIFRARKVRTAGPGAAH